MDEKKKKTTTKKTNTKTSTTNKTGVKKTTTTKKRMAKKTTPKKTVTPKQSVKVEKDIFEEKIIEEKTSFPEELKETKGVSYEEPKKETKAVWNESSHLKTIIMVVVSFLVLAVGVIVAFIKAEESGASYSEKWKDKSYLVEKEYAASLTCDGISNAILGSQAFILVTSFSEEEFHLEKDLARLIRENHIDDFYVYSLNDSCGSVTDASSTASQNLLLTEGLKHTPAILYYRDGKLEEVALREDEKMLEVGDFQKLLDIYEITK